MEEVPHRSSNRWWTPLRKFCLKEMKLCWLACTLSHHRSFYQSISTTSSLELIMFHYLVVESNEAWFILDHSDVRNILGRLIRSQEHSLKFLLFEEFSQNRGDALSGMSGALWDVFSHSKEHNGNGLISVGMVDSLSYI